MLTNLVVPRLLLWAAETGNGGSPWDLGQVAEILKLGSIGLAFLLVGLAAWLFINLRKTTEGTNLPAGVVVAFLAFTVVIFAFFLVAQYFDQSKIAVAEHNRLMREQKEQSDEIIATMKNMHMISGKISMPKEGETPGTKKIECGGTVSKYHKESGLHLWLAVEVKGFIWPKEPELDVKPNGEWAAPIFQDGPEKPFSLDLLVVDDKTHQNFMNWIHERKFDKMAWPEGALRLDRIDGLQLKEKP